MDALRQSIQDREAKAGVKPIRAESPAAGEEEKEESETEASPAQSTEKPAAKPRRKRAS